MSDSTTSKPLSKRDSGQVLQAVFNEADKTLTTAGFVDAKVGHKISRTQVSLTVDDFRYFDVYATPNVTTSIGIDTITVSESHNVTVGSYIFSTAFPANTTVIGVTGTTVQLSTNATVSTTEDVKIAKLLKRIRVTYDSSRANVDDTERLD